MNHNDYINIKIKKEKEERRRRREEYLKNNSVDKTMSNYDYHAKAFKRCETAVSWKGLNQKAAFHPIKFIYDTISEYKEDGVVVHSKAAVTIRERGKERTITPINIYDRQPRKVFVENLLCNAIVPTLIRENGASIKNRGIEDSRNIVLKQMRNFASKYGNSGYFVMFDFKGYFNNIPHSKCREKLSKVLKDEEAVEYEMNIIKSQAIKNLPKELSEKERIQTIKDIQDEKGSGITLGSQDSQMIAVLIPSDLDHFIKYMLKPEGFLRYMDDIIIMVKTKEEALSVYDAVVKFCGMELLKLNFKKSHIIKATKIVTFLKRKYIIKGNKVYVLPTRDSVVRMRRKLKKFKRFVDIGKMSLDDVYQSYQSWLEHMRKTKHRKVLFAMKKLYNRLYNGYNITKKYFNSKEYKESVILQNKERRKYRWSEQFGELMLSST